MYNIRKNKKIKKTNRVKKSNTMKLFISLFLVLSITLVTFANHTIKNISKETQVIYVFNNKTKKLTNILLYEAVLGKKGAAFVEKFENSTFFTGFVKGDFKENKGELLPLKGAKSFVILRDNSSLFDMDLPAFLKKNQYPQTDVFFPVEEFLPGDMFIILFNSMESKIKVEIMKNDKKETVLKVL